MDFISSIGSTTGPLTPNGGNEIHLRPPGGPAGCEGVGTRKCEIRARKEPGETEGGDVQGAPTAQRESPNDRTYETTR